MQTNERQVQEITNYLRQGEKGEADLKIGLEVEHLVLDCDTLCAVSYYQRHGIADILKTMQKAGWQGVYEDKYLLGLTKNGNNISLEPGGQLEISIKPHQNISDIEDEYLDFLEDLIPILEANNQMLVAIGYQPQTKIKDIPFIPKERYRYMSAYLQRQGKYALNMMKGTAAMHVNIDYRSEADYIQKFKIANCLYPVVAAMFDNVPFFEGEITTERMVKCTVWQNCDDDRCGIVDGTFRPGYSYQDYARYILNTPAIVLKKGSNLVPCTKKYQEVFQPDNYTWDELEYMLTMVFPDIRTKHFIEIRIADSVPYPLNIAGVALWKGIMYNQDNLKDLERCFATVTAEEINAVKKRIKQQGYDAHLLGGTIHDWAKYVISLAQAGLPYEEKHYLKPLEVLVEQKLSPADVTKARLHNGKKAALSWCILNNLWEGGCGEFQQSGRTVRQSGKERRRSLL